MDDINDLTHHMMTELNIKAITYVGLWPSSVENHPILNKLHKWYSCINLFMFFLFYILMNIQLAFILDNIFQLTFNLSISLLYTIIIAKISFLIFNRKSVSDIVEKTNHFQNQIMSGENNENKLVFMEYVKHVRTATKSFWIMVFLGYNLLILPGYSALFGYNYKIENDGSITKPLAFSCYLYFDQQKYHAAAFIIQVIIAIPGTSFVAVWDTFFFSLMMCAICQMKVLQNLLMSLGQDKNKTIHQSAVECVQIHQEIIQYMTDLDSLTSNILFLDFLVYAILLCSIGYRAFFDPDVDLTVVISCSAYLIAILIQLYMFYWNGHIIMEESEEIANAVWKSNWYQYDKSVLKSLLIVMIRAQKPLRLTVGRFYILNVESLVTILRAWYSYMTILNQMNEG